MMKSFVIQCQLAFFLLIVTMVSISHQTMVGQPVPPPPRQTKSPIKPTATTKLTIRLTRTPSALPHQSINVMSMVDIHNDTDDMSLSLVLAQVPPTAPPLVNNGTSMEVDDEDYVERTPDAFYSGKVKKLGGRCSFYGHDVERIQDTSHDWRSKRPHIDLDKTCDFHRRLECIPNPHNDTEEALEGVQSEVYMRREGTCQCLRSMEAAVYLSDIQSLPEMGGKCFISADGGSCDDRIEIYIPYGEIDMGKYQMRNILPPSRLCQPNSECVRENVSDEQFVGTPQCQCLPEFEFDKKTKMCSSTPNVHPNGSQLFSILIIFFFHQCMQCG